MDLEEFLKESLEQIISGIQKAQASEHGMNVNAAGMGNSGNLYDSGSNGLFTRVDFDVAVTVENSRGGKGSLKVWSIGVEGSGEHKAHFASRVSFAVPLRLPDGDQQRAVETRRKAQETEERRMKEIRDLSESRNNR